MYRKNYGKISFAGWMNLELEQCNPGIVIACGVLELLGGIFVKIWGASPYPVLLVLKIGDIVPPVWLLTFLWSAALFSVGCAFGMILSHKKGGCNEKKYQAGMLFLLLFVLELLWYPILFSSILVFVSLVAALFILFIALLLTLMVHGISRLSFWILLLHDLFLLYFTVLNIGVLFRG